MLDQQYPWLIEPIVGSTNASADYSALVAHVPLCQADSDVRGVVGGVETAFLPQAFLLILPRCSAVLGVVKWSVPQGFAVVAVAVVAVAEDEGEGGQPAQENRLEQSRVERGAAIDCKIEHWHEYNK